MPYRDVILAALERSGRSAREVSLAAVGHESAIRSLKRGMDIRGSTIAALCEELGLEFHVGSPNDRYAPEAEQPSGTAVPAKASKPSTPSAKPGPQVSGEGTGGREALREEMASILKVEAQAIRKEVCEGINNHLHALQGQATPPRTPPANDLEDSGALGVHATEDGATDVPGVRSVRMIEMEAAAGGGAYNLDEAPVAGPVWFRRDWIDSHGMDPTQAVVISVRGDSMEPTLPAGCKILVNRQRRRRRVGNIYVITTPDGLIVKRLGRGEGGGWLLVSDNDSPDWPDMPWPDDAVVAGEVKWMARELP